MQNDDVSDVCDEHKSIDLAFCTDDEQKLKTLNFRCCRLFGASLTNRFARTKSSKNRHYSPVFVCFQFGFFFLPLSFLERTHEISVDTNTI